MITMPGVSVATDALADSPSGSSLRGSHRMAAAVSCERLWWLRYHQGIRLHPRLEPEYRVSGSLIHLGLAYWYASKLPVAPPWYTALDLDARLAIDGAGHPLLQVNAKAILAQYVDCWREEPWEPVAVEQEFGATLLELHPRHDPTWWGPSLDHEIVTCRLDLLMRHTDTGALWIWDHKTVGGGWGARDKLPIWNPEGEFALNWQVLTNLHIVRKRLAPQRVTGFLINRLQRRPDSEGRYHFDRQPLEVPPLAYQAAPRTMRAMVAREVYLAAKADTDPKQLIPNYAACYGRYGACDYRSLCRAGTQAEQAGLLQTCYICLDDVRRSSDRLARLKAVTREQ